LNKTFQTHNFLRFRLRGVFIAKLVAEHEILRIRLSRTGSNNQTAKVSETTEANSLVGVPGACIAA
jgi:hypothetical protein